MTHYDPNTDTIHGAESGTWAYLHEERHREQYARGMAQRADQMHMWLYYAAFIAGPVGAWKLGEYGWFIGVGIAMTPHIMALAYLEADAYLVGTWRWMRR